MVKIKYKTNNLNIPSTHAAIETREFTTSTTSSRSRKGLRKGRNTQRSDEPGLQGSRRENLKSLLESLDLGLTLRDALRIRHHLHNSGAAIDAPHTDV